MLWLLMHQASKMGLMWGKLNSISMILNIFFYYVTEDKPQMIFSNSLHKDYYYKYTSSSDQRSQVGKPGHNKPISLAHEVNQVRKVWPNTKK